jgi:hypothetical protein
MSRDHVGVAAGGDAPRRLTLSQIVELLLTKGGGEHSSVSLTRNAKGETQIEVTVRTGESDEVTTVDQAAAKAKATYNELRETYPHGASDA